MCRDPVRTISEVRALIDAIFMGDLLSALPSSEIDRERHRAGLALLEIARSRLEAPDIGLIENQ